LRFPGVFGYAIITFCTVGAPPSACRKFFAHVRQSLIKQGLRPGKPLRFSAFI
jgi:hypothetical protein